MMKRSATRMVAMATRALHPRPQSLSAVSVLLDAVRSAPFTTHSGLPKGLNTNNPFEIKFHTEHVDSAPEVEVEDNASIESSFLEDEIERFHLEMLDVFGSEPHDHDDGSHDHPEAHPPSHHVGHTAATRPGHPAIASIQPERTVPPPLHRTPTMIRPTRHVTCGQPAVLLIQGPCTYVHDGWVGSKDGWSASDVESVVDSLAQSHGVDVVQHHSNHEGEILDWLLKTTPNDSIILNWNGRLADSPTIYRALSSIRSHVVILAPLNLELGPLPPSVKGVISGFGTKSLELAIQACK